MNRINHLPDELLLRILTYLPTSKDVVTTMVLSKRWQFLWMFVPKLVYDDTYQSPEYGRFSRFVDRSLFMHEAPVIETMHFKLGQICDSGDIQVWIRAAHKCCVRELILEIVPYRIIRCPVIKLPRSLYTCCRMLVTLKLVNAVLVDDVSLSSGCFSSLKKLSLIYMKYPGDEFVNKLISSSCPVLEELVVKIGWDDKLTIFNIISPSLKSLVLYVTWSIYVPRAHEVVIDAPSLELLDVFDETDGSFVVESNMPKIVEAKVIVSYDHPQQILGSITSVKRLHFCGKDAYPGGSIFCCLVSLNICACEVEWLNLLIHLLRDSPKLRTLKFEMCRGLETYEPCKSWIEPDSVPECLLWSLETVQWVEYRGTAEEKEVVKFILRNGSCLKKVTINSETTDSHKKLRMIKELTFSPRRSPTCLLAFD